MTVQEVFNRFLKDMEQPAIRMAAHNSFRRYTTLRDQLIQYYSDRTGIPADEFHSQLAYHNAKDLL